MGQGRTDMMEFQALDNEFDRDAVSQQVNHPLHHLIVKFEVVINGDHLSSFA